MRGLRLGVGVLVLASVLAVPSASGALAPGQLDVRSTSVDYESGQTIEWTVDWIEKQAGATDDVVVNLGGPHSLVPDSIVHPRGWTVKFSEDGKTYTDEPQSKVTHVKFARTSRTIFPAAVSAVALADDILVQNLIPRPVPAITTARSGGDGYIPMLAGDRIYGVWHHLPAGGDPEPNMVCIDTLTGKTCPTYPKVLGWQTSYNQGQGIFLNNRLYFKNRDARTHGVLCWNTATEKSCGYAPVATLGPVTGTAGGDGGWDQFSSPVLHGGRLYFAGHDMRVYCFDPATDAACADYGLAGKATARFGERHVTTRLVNDVMYHDGKMIFSLATSWADAPVPLGTKDTCFDLVAAMPCAGWGTNGVVTETAGTAYLFPRYDNTGTVTGFCHGVRSGTGDAPLEATAPCYDLNGRNRTTIKSVQAFAQFRPYNVEEATIGTRTFFGRYSAFGGYCYDWSTSAPCTGQYFDANGRSTKSLDEHFYGFVRRGECAVGLGHRGVFMSLDPITGGSPCRRLVDSNFVSSASSRFCGDTKYLTGWRLGLGSDISKVDFEKLDVTVTDGTTVVAGDLLSGNVVLNGLDPTKDLRVSVSGSVKTTADPWVNGTPALNFLYSGSSQFCFRTVAEKATKPVEIEARTLTDSDTEIVPVDPTPDDIGEPADPPTVDDEVAPSGRGGSTGVRTGGRLPATGVPVTPFVFWSLVLVGGGAVIVTRRPARRRH